MRLSPIIAVLALSGTPVLAQSCLSPPPGSAMTDADRAAIAARIERQTSYPTFPQQRRTSLRERVRVDLDDLYSGLDTARAEATDDVPEAFREGTTFAAMARHLDSLTATQSRIDAAEAEAGALREEAMRDLNASITRANAARAHKQRAYGGKGTPSGSAGLGGGGSSEHRSSDQDYVWCGGLRGCEDEFGSSSGNGAGRRTHSRTRGTVVE